MRTEQVHSMQSQVGCRRASAISVVAVSTVLILVCVLASVVPYHMWPHDEGQYGQSAHRVLEGDVPHRDFHEMYTGLLTFWNAAVFAVAGKSLLHLRYALVLSCVPAAWVTFDMVWRLTRRQDVATVVTFCSWVISVGMTHGAAATLYSSICSVLSIWMLFRYVESPSWEWVFGAGVVSGVAILVKVTGMFVFAGAGMALVFHGASGQANGSSAPGRRLRDGMIRGGIALVTIGAMTVLLWERLSWNVVLYFALPILCSALLLLCSGCSIDARRLSLHCLVLLGGALIPLILFCAPFAKSGALGMLFDGVFVLPRVRIADVFMPPPAQWMMVLGIPACACFCTRSRLIQYCGLASIVVLCAAAMNDPVRSEFRTFGLMCAIGPWRWVVPVIVPMVSWRFLRFARFRPTVASQVFVILSGSVWFCLNQFPFSAVIYFFYGFPHIALLGIAAARVSEEAGGQISKERRRSPVLSGTWAVAFFCIFCSIRFGTDGLLKEFFGKIGEDGAPVVISGIVVPQSLGRDYVAVRSYLRQSLEQDETILAGPDAPEVYFFCGMRNLTPVVYDFYVKDEDYESRLLSLARSKEIGAIVVKLHSYHSEGWSEELLDGFESLSSVCWSSKTFLIFRK